MNDQIKKISVSMAARDIAIVNRLAKQGGLNFSSALRLIVREWDDHKSQTTTTNTNKGGNQDNLSKE